MSSLLLMASFAQAQTISSSKYCPNDPPSPYTPSGTNTPTNTSTATSTFTATNSLTATPTRTFTNTATGTQAPTATLTQTPAFTPSSTFTPTPTWTASFTSTVTATPTSTVPDQYSIKISVYNEAGELMKTLRGVQGTTATATWDTAGLASGLYLAVVDEVSPQGGSLKRQVIKVIVVH